MMTMKAQEKVVRCILLLIGMNLVVLAIWACIFVLGRTSEPLRYNVEAGSIKKERTVWSMNLTLRDKPNETIAEIPRCLLRIERLDKKVLRLKITQDGRRRWEAPLDNPNAGQGFQPEPMNESGFAFSESPFFFNLTDPESNIPLINPEKATPSLIFGDRYLELGLSYPTPRLFGLGERVSQHFDLCHNKTDCVYTIFNRDQVAVVDDETGGKNLYSSHPVTLFHYLNGKTSLFYAVLVLNSNAQDVFIKTAEGLTTVRHVMVGGIFDVYFFYAGDVEVILQKYHTFIGKPYLPPLWAFGYQQSRWGWSHLDAVRTVVAKFDAHDIPLEVVWEDIDYMYDYADFSIDPVKFKDLPDFVDILHTKKMRWVPIIDAGIKADPKDKYYQKGEATGAFTKSANTSKTLIARVWPGPAVFADWYQQSATDLYWQGYGDLYAKAQFDGIWLDMNEVSSFCDGECPETENVQEVANSGNNHDPHEFDHIPYTPGHAPLNRSTISMTGYHNSTDPFDDETRKEYNVHNLYGLYEAKVLYRFFTEKLKRRPFSLTRSSFVGSGQYTSKWTGDNAATWDFMQASLIGLYNYQIFGLIHSGADICGFIGNTTEELCGRWMQVGAFYPFSRNHNCAGYNDQEPYVFGERVIEASKTAIRQKYSILRYYYTKMFEVAANGGSLFKPTFFEFPQDNKAFAYTETQIMLGSSLLVVPALTQNAKKVVAYCPNANWYNLITRSKICEFKSGAEEGKVVELPDDFKFVNVLLRGGSIIPYQDTVKYAVRRTKELDNLPMELIIAPQEEKASGTLFVDDGESPNTIPRKAYRLYNFIYDNKVLKVSQQGQYRTTYPYEQVTTVSLLEAGNWPQACITHRGGRTLMEGTYKESIKEMVYELKNLRISWAEVSEIRFDKGCWDVRSFLLELKWCLHSE